jgi:hypothetical protein
MRTVTLIVTLALSLAGLVSAQDAQEKKAQEKPKAAHKATSKATKSRGSGDAADPNIKGGSDVNKPDANVPAPPNKGGTGRQGVCQIHVDNRTGLYVRIYVDGDYKGVIGPWGDGITYTLSGATTLYGRANYDDGTYSSFGPQVVSCYGTFTWSLTS